MSRLQSAATSADPHQRVLPVAPASVSHATGDGECCERRSCAVLTALPPVIKCRMTVLLRAVGYASFCIRTANGNLDRFDGIVRISRGQRRALIAALPESANSTDSKLAIPASERSTHRGVSGGLKNSQTGSAQQVWQSRTFFFGFLAAPVAAARTTRMRSFGLRRRIRGVPFANLRQNQRRAFGASCYESSHHEDFDASESSRTDHQPIAAQARLDAGRFCRSPSACRVEYQPERSCENGSAARACRRQRALLSATGLAGGREGTISTARSPQVHPRRNRRVVEQRTRRRAGADAIDRRADRVSFGKQP